MIRMINNNHTGMDSSRKTGRFVTDAVSMTSTYQSATWTGPSSVLPRMLAGKKPPVTKAGTRVPPSQLDPLPWKVNRVRGDAAQRLRFAANMYMSIIIMT